MRMLKVLCPLVFVMALAVPCASAAEVAAGEPAPAAPAPAEGDLPAVETPADCATFDLGTPAFLPPITTICGRCSQTLCRGEDVGAVCDTGKKCVVTGGSCSIGGMTCTCV